MQEQSSPPILLKFWQPLDRAAVLTILILGLLIGLLLSGGDRSAPRVRDFSWQDKLVGREDAAFVLTFSRPMDHTSVERNLQIGPPLPGKISWAGRRMVYTLDAPAPYGTQYQVLLKEATDQFAGSKSTSLVAFSGQFQTRDRAFVYIGVEGEEAGRLVLYNLNRQQKQVLTPANMLVMDFKPYPEGRQILFSAVERSQSQALMEQKLYRVTTGLPLQSTLRFREFPFFSNAEKTKPPGHIRTVLDSKDYQNLKFDLSADGQTIVVQRVKRNNPGEFGLWILNADAAPRPLNNQPGGDFVITPDSSAIAMGQGEGLAILPLTSAAKPLDFLPQYGQMLNFSLDGTQAAVVKFNKADYTRSLFLVSTQGTQKELLRTNGSILKAQFDPTAKILYCLLTQLIPGPTYREQPYLAAVDLKQEKVIPLLLLPEQREIDMNLAPDGLALLFDQVIPQSADQVKEAESRGEQATLSTADGKPIQASRLWLLPLPQVWDRERASIQPQSLPLSGIQPQWLP
jgi:dipeptidyl aminopeptidase/acylaminoacyl peptidase